MKIRTATFDDLKKIKELCIRNNLKVDKIYKEVWQNFPKSNEFENVPIGWVLENNEKNIVGVILNLYMNYILKDKTFINLRKIIVSSSKKMFNYKFI